jgi:hypothetical protein
MRPPTEAPLQSSVLWRTVIDDQKCTRSAPQLASMCTQGPSRLVFLVQSWICGPSARLPRHIAGTPQPSTLPPSCQRPLAADPAPCRPSRAAKYFDGRFYRHNRRAGLWFRPGAHRRWPFAVVAITLIRTGPLISQSRRATAAASARSDDDLACPTSSRRRSKDGFCLGALKSQAFRSAPPHVEWLSGSSAEFL